MTWKTPIHELKSKSKLSGDQRFGIRLCYQTCRDFVFQKTEMCRAVGQFFDEIRIYGFRLDRDQQLPPPSPMNYWWLMDKIKFPSWNGQKKWDDWFIRDKYSISLIRDMLFVYSARIYSNKKPFHLSTSPPKQKNRSVQKTVFFVKKADPLQRFESVSQKIHQILSKSQLHIGIKDVIPSSYFRRVKKRSQRGEDFFWEQISSWLFGESPPNGGEFSKGIHSLGSNLPDFCWVGRCWSWRWICWWDEAINGLGVLATPPKVGFFRNENWSQRADMKGKSIFN